MSVTIEHWRAAIGSFRGGRSCISTSSTFNTRHRQGHRKYGSSGCLATLLLLIALLFFPILLCVWSYLPSYSYSSISSRSFYVEEVPYQSISDVCYWSPPIQSELAGLHGPSHAGKADVPRVSRKKSTS